MLNLKKLVFLAFLTVLSLPAQAVVIDGKDWRQLTESLGFGYNDLAVDGICSEVTGICGGEQRGVSFDRWIWATLEEVGQLYNSIVGPYDFEVPRLYTEANSIWAPRVLDIDGLLTGDTGLFFATNVTTQYAWIVGMTRTLSTQNLVYTPFIHDSYSGSRHDVAITSSTAGISGRNSHYGVWLYRNVAIPEPTTLVLVTVGLVGIGYRHRQKALGSNLNP